MKTICMFLLFCVAFLSCRRDKLHLFEPLPRQPAYQYFPGVTGISGNSTIESYDNHLIITGTKGAFISILKITKDGEQVWRSDLDAGSRSIACSIAETADHSLFVCGETQKNAPTNQKDILLVKLDQHGDTVWTRTYGKAGDEQGLNIIATSDGNLLVAAKITSWMTGGFADLYVLKINTNGDTLWTRTYPKQEQAVPCHLLETKNKEYIITADRTASGAFYSLKIAENGKLLWSQRLLSQQPKRAFSTIELSGGDFLTCGSISTGFPRTDVLIARTDHNGEVLWEKSFGDQHLAETGHCVRLNDDSTVVIVGSSVDWDKNTSSLLVLKLDADGKELYRRSYGTVSNLVGINLINSDNDNNVITGTNSSGMFITRFDRNGDFK